MMQLQISIEAAADNKISMQIWQLAREDANDGERALVAALEEMVVAAAEHIQKSGAEVTKQYIKELPAQESQ